MPIRSTRITLYNNTSFQLTRYDCNTCEGKWTDGSQAPLATIDAGMDGLGKCLPTSQRPFWQSESGGGSFLTGTEGYVQYVLDATTIDSTASTVPSPELITIHWDNPFVWDEGTTPIDFPLISTTTDVAPPCPPNLGDGTIVIGVDNTDRKFKGIGGSPQHELFIANSMNIGQGIDLGSWGGVFYIALFCDWMLVNTLWETSQDIHVEFTVVLRKKRSVGSTICSFYDGKMGLKALTKKTGLSSLKTLFNF